MVPHVDREHFLYVFANNTYKYSSMMYAQVLHSYRTRYHALEALVLRSVQFLRRSQTRCKTQRNKKRDIPYPERVAGIESVAESVVACEAHPPCPSGVERCSLLVVPLPFEVLLSTPAPKVETGARSADFRGAREDLRYVSTPGATPMLTDHRQASVATGWRSIFLQHFRVHFGRK